jgi:Bravo-like intracellular region
VASSASLISNKSGGPDAVNDSDDTDSLDDDPDVNKFNEDGSFIGVYGQDQNADYRPDDEESRLLSHDASNDVASQDKDGTVQVSHTQNTFV